MRLTWSRHDNAARWHAIVRQPMANALATKPYRVEWIGEPGAAVATFDDLQTAIRYVGELRLDQQHIVICRDQVVWPNNVRRSAASPTGILSRPPPL